MMRAGDPFSSGLVASLARPGGNVTGLVQYSPELLGKRLELLKEVVPKVSRFAFLSDSVSMFKNAPADAKGLGVRFQLVEVKGPNPDFDGAFRVVVNERIGAVVTEATPLLSAHRKRILELVEKESHTRDALGARMGDRRRSYVLRVEPSRSISPCRYVRGQDPQRRQAGRSSCRTAHEFEFIINLKAAKQIGLIIPPNCWAGRIGLLDDQRSEVGSQQMRREKIHE